MNYRNYELLAAESISTAATKTIDLKGLNPISRISIQTKQTQSNTDFTGNHPADIITKVSLVDGSTPLWEASGPNVQALDWYNGRKSQLNLWYDFLENWSLCNFSINFGRKLFDPMLAFDPSRFKNPQLKIEHNYVNGQPTGGSTAQTLKVDLDMFDQKIISPIGFLSFIEVFQKALVASGSEYIDLPLDHIIRSLTLHALYPSRNPAFEFESLKLTENNGDRVVIEQNLREFIPSLPTFRLFHEQKQGLTYGGLRNMRCTPAYHARAMGTVDNNDSYIYSRPNDGGRLQIGHAGGGQQALYDITGYCPHGAVNIPFGDIMDMDDWYDVTGLKKLQLKVTASQYATDANDQTILVEQLRRY